MSGLHQQKPIREYLTKQHRIGRRRFWFCVSQYLLLAAFLVTAFVIDWKKALLYILIPQQVSLYVVLIFNYVQHVHANRTHASTIRWPFTKIRPTATRTVRAIRDSFVISYLAAADDYLDVRQARSNVSNVSGQPHRGTGLQPRPRRQP